jgi:hypothetical protein
MPTTSVECGPPPGAIRVIREIRVIAVHRLISSSAQYCEAFHEMLNRHPPAQHPA